MWSKDTELLFFKESRKIVSDEQLFYVTDDNRYVAYWPNDYKGKKSTLQSRNSLIGNFTEKWTANLIRELLANSELYVLQNVQCEEIGLNYRSPADIVIATKNDNILKPKDIKLIFEVKMSLVWNWELNKDDNSITELGNYKTHQGSPSLLRSDSILKAIRKCINIRVSNNAASKIPLIIIGNTPITETSSQKMDYLKNAGIIQGVWSINSKPLGSENTLKNTKSNGFIRFDNKNELKNEILKNIDNDKNFFSSMKSTEELGKIIENADKKETYDQKGVEFLRLIRGN